MKLGSAVKGYYIHAMATSFFYIFVMATSFFYIYIEGNDERVTKRASINILNILDTNVTKRNISM